MSDSVEYMFEPSILNDLDLSEYDITFEEGASVANPEEDFVLRPLSSSDYEKGNKILLLALSLFVAHQSQSTIKMQFIIFDSILLVSIFS